MNDKEREARLRAAIRALNEALPIVAVEPDPKARRRRGIALADALGFEADVILAALEQAASEHGQ